MLICFYGIAIKQNRQKEAGA
jgi:hypothetical protein